MRVTSMPLDTGGAAERRRTKDRRVEDGHAPDGVERRRSIEPRLPEVRVLEMTEDQWRSVAKLFGVEPDSVGMRRPTPGSP
jgi:hypothetical protein